MPVSGHVFRPDFVPVSFSSFPFLCEDITLQRSRQDGVAGTVTMQDTDDKYDASIGQDNI